MIISGKAKPIRMYFNKRHSFEFFLFKNLSNFKRLIFFWYKFMVVTIEKKTHQEIWIHVMIKLYILDQLPITFYSSFRTTYNCVLTYVIHKRMFHKQCEWLLLIRRDRREMSSNYTKMTLCKRCEHGWKKKDNLLSNIQRRVLLAIIWR